jgi:hypothetical protein
VPAGFAMVQALMKGVGFFTCVIAVCLLPLVVFAQQTETARLADAPAAAFTALNTTSDTLSTLPASNALVRAAAPQTQTEHKFFDRQQMIALYVHSGVRLADTINTCHALANGGKEDWIPTQSCAGIAAWQAGSVGLTLGLGWLFHKTGHHKLERITPWVGTGASVAGLTKSTFNLR